MLKNDDDLDRAARLLADGDAAGAADLLKQTTQVEPENGRAYLFLGVALSKTGDFSGGVDALRRASHLLPAQAAVWFNLGVALTKMDEMREAQNALERAISIDPGHATARAALATIAPDSALLGSPTLSGPIRRASGYGPDVAGAQAGPRYVPMVAPTAVLAGVQPSAVRKVARGLGWGFVCAQYWTLLKMFWYFVWGGSKNGLSTTVFFAVALLVICGLMGSVAGVVIAARNSNAAKCMTIGGIAGLLIFALQFFFVDGASLSMLFSAIFWFFTGKYVGVNIAKRVYAPIR